jgi:LacI family transcriptional regulator
MAPTIKDVAKKANVSIATVSLVIHNHKRISPETREKVNKAITDLHYYPSHSARGLVSRKTGNIGFILTEDHFLRSEPFYTHIFLGAEFEARQYERYILLTTVPSIYSKEDKLPRFVLERNIDGIIIAGKIPQELIAKLGKLDIPLVFVDYYPPEKKYPVVLIDNISGGQTATQHLIDCGHTGIGFIGGDIEHPSINDRFLGYKMALEKAGIKFDPSLCVVDEDYPARENGYRAAKKLLRNNKITAIFTCNDAMALGVMQYLKENNYRIPEDISLVGFDDVESGMFLDPPLTTVKVLKMELGIEVVRLMNDVLQNRNKSINKILVPTELVVRKSAAILKDKKR